jgi:hypothetical protein
MRRGKPNRFITGHNTRGKRKDYPILTCEQCGQSFTLRPSAAKHRQFCNIDCRNAYNRKQIGPLNRSYSRIPLACALCGTVTFHQKSDIRGGRIPYCSIECGKEARRQKLKALGHARTKPHCWNHGKTAALARDNRSCRICGFSMAVHAHHIEHRANGGSNHVSNMITLCPNHHALAHAGHLSKDELKSYISRLPTTIIVPR